MLERAAASLDSCSLQRLLARPARPPNRRRRLHTGFWQHGAAAIELAGLWPLPARPAVDSPSRPLRPGLVASAFLLDFLYPTSMHALLRRLAPMPQDAVVSTHRARKRCFNSSTAAADHHDWKLLAPPEDAGATGRHGDDAPDSASSDSATLTRLLSQPNQDHLLDFWDLYMKLDPSQRPIFRCRIALRLSQSDSVVQVGRASSLFREMATESWDDETQAAAVQTMMRSAKPAVAMAWLQAGMANSGQPGGMEHVLPHVIAGRQWSTLLEIWSGLSACGPHADSAESRLLNLGTIPDLAKLYLSLEHFIDVEGADAVRSINLSRKSRRNLRILLWNLAEQSLRQDCVGKLAAVILERWKDPRLYELYILRMLDRWDRGLEARDGLAILEALYSRYRTFPGVKPPADMLRGMLKLRSPADLAGMEEIYRDWHKAWGDLDQWAYEKYLQFYSETGDAAAVRYLWARYVGRYPDILKSPSAFMSIMTVYAHTGDGARAEREVGVMMQEYGLVPDMAIWNALLECHTRAGNDEDVLRCLEEIRRIDKPDSSTYAHLMSLAARRGDLRAVLGHFDEAQAEGVALTPAMARPLVLAYCRNDRLVAAETICRELSTRKLASTAAWNQLLLFHAAQRNLRQLKGLLQVMRTFGLDWDQDTYKALLQGLVNIRHIHPAYQLLRSALEDNLFPVGPEHFEIVIAGMVDSGVRALLPPMLSLMRKAKRPASFNAQVKLFEMAAQHAPSATRTRNMGQELIGHLRSLIPPQHDHSHQGLRHGVPPPHVVGDMAKLRAQTRTIDRAVLVLMNLRKFRTAEELVTVYSDLFPEYKGGAFPPKLTGALMVGCLQDDRVAKTIAMWHEMLKVVMARYKHPREGAVYPAHWYELCRPMAVVTKAFRKADDGPGLVQCVERVLATDFRLTRTNWNLIIRALTEMGQWERAMTWCETWLMPNWSGWSGGPRTSRERRRLQNPRFLKPSVLSVFSLQKDWLNLRKQAAWSGDVAHKLKAVEEGHPRLFHAFITNHFKYLPAAWVVRQSPSMNKAIRKLLRPLTFKELLAMKRALEHQMRLQPAKRMIRSLLSPFHVATGLDHDVVLTKAFSYRELQLLQVELRDRIAAMAKKGLRPPKPALSIGPLFGKRGGGRRRTLLRIRSGVGRRA